MKTIAMILVLLATLTPRPIHAEGSTDLVGLEKLYKLEKIMLSSMGIK
jgi:hypothetical protein